MTAITWFGVAAVSAMLVFYALEDRGRRYVLLFAAACLAASLYGFLQGAWPFGIVEAIWSAVALGRWQRRRQTGSKPSPQPIACDMTALSAAERQRYDVLRRAVMSSIEHVTASSTAFHLRLRESASLPQTAEWMTLEHRCCPFLTLEIALKDDGTSWIAIGGSEAIKAFVAGEFPVVTAAASYSR